MGVSTNSFSLESTSFPDTKLARPVRIKQAKDIADMIADIYKVGPLTYPKVFQCVNGSEFKVELPKMLEKHGVMMRCIMTKYKHM